MFVAAFLRRGAGNSGHNHSNELLEVFDIPTGSYVSVQLRGNIVLTGFLRNPPALNIVQNRLILIFPNSDSLIADLSPLHTDNSANYPDNRCFIRMRHDFFLSAFLDSNFNTRGGTSVRIIQRNPNTHDIVNIYYGILGHYDGFLPTWAQNIRN